MRIHPPCYITSRLMVGIRIGDMEISIGYADRPGDNGRTRYRYKLELGCSCYEADDLQSGAQGGSLQEGLDSLFSFLAACGESYGHYLRITGHASEAEWAYHSADELSAAALDFENSETPLIDETN